ncbi:MAG: hypothetical protein JXA57_16665 [Armatimonadetes bacterium]|nr:hypothetical protein [Armatimonadota bacterium]
MQTTDLPPTAGGRLRELAAILARGLLRLHSRPHIDASAEPATPEESSESSRNSLDFPDTARRDRPTG